jgi:FkbM family methyltransferase
MRKLPIEIVNGFHNRMMLFKNDCGLSDVIRGGGLYESYIFDWIQKNNIKTEGTRIIDVGANVGNHTLEFAHLVGETGQVYAFEAQRIVYYMLCGNIAMNGFENIHAFNFAIGDQNDTIVSIETPDFHSKETINVGSMHVKKRISLGDSIAEVRTVDSFGLDNTSIMKIDVEGFEPFVLDGAKDTILNCKPIIFIEIWDANLNFHGFTPGDVYDRLDDLGYDCHNLAGIDFVAVPR